VTEEKTYRVLVAAPTYLGKDYALDQYLRAYEAFTFSPRGLLLVDNTRDNGEYAAHLEKLGVPVRRVEPSMDFEETFTRCWRVILEEALVGEYEWVLSLESDVIGPPQLIVEMLSIADFVQAPFVTQCYPYHNKRLNEYYQGMGCVLMTTTLLQEAMSILDEPDSPWVGIVEASVYEIAKRNSHVSLATRIPLQHLDHPGGGAIPSWDWDEITDPRVVKV